MERVRVKMLDGIAGLPDPRPKEELDLRYEKWRHQMETQARPPSKASIEANIEELKLKDRYGELILGFPKSWSFKPGDEALINADLAEKWEASGLALIVTDEKRASA